MSRTSLAAFLSKAKQSLSQSVRSKGAAHASFVIGNQSADLDSIACALVYGYVQSHTATARKSDKYWIPVTNIPSSESRLRPELTALLKNVDLKPSDLITLDDLTNLHQSLPAESTDWTLVDHNGLLGELGQHYSKQVNGVIDHHEDEQQVSEHAEPRVIENAGSCNSLVVNYCRDDWDSLPSSGSTDSIGNDSAGVAILALGAILIDTVNLTAESKVTEYDRRAVEYLEKKIRASPTMGKKYDRDAFFEEINDAKSDLDALSLDDILRKDYKQWTEGDLTLGISSAVKPVQYLMKKATKFEDAILDFAKSRNLDLFAIMTAHNDSDSFGRQLLLLAVKDGKAVEVAERFVGENEKTLDLEDSQTGLDSGLQWVRFWEQGDLSSSRKQVAPMLREAMS